MRLISLVALAIAGFSAPVLADDAKTIAGPQLCWIAGMQFSPGVSVRGASGVTVCRSDGTWAIVAEADAAGCFADGQIYAVGASRALDGVKGGKQICHKDGTWG